VRAAWLLCWLLASCTPLPAPRAADGGPRTELLYVVAGGWHTEIALPAAAARGPLAALRRDFPAAPYLVFGWGARDYYMARDPGIGDLLRAMTPGPAVMLVVPLAVSPAAFAGEANTVALRVTPEGLARLSQRLWDDLAKDAGGAPLVAGAGPYPGSMFYASVGTYDLGHTCNTWTAEALAAAGLPINPAGVVLAGPLLDQLRPLAAAGA
jgi:uncharacterized protein (TIGR02117 family)